jgi:hypothetical protein
MIPETTTVSKREQFGFKFLSVLGFEYLQPHIYLTNVLLFEPHPSVLEGGFVK